MRAMGGAQLRDKLCLQLRPSLVLGCQMAVVRWQGSDQGSLQHIQAVRRCLVRHRKQNGSTVSFVKTEYRFLQPSPLPRKPTCGRCSNLS